MTTRTTTSVMKQLDLFDPEPYRIPTVQRITGIDPSLCSTGVGIITRRVNGTCIANTHTITSTARKGDTLTDNAGRRHKLLDEIGRIAAGSALAVIENPSYASKSAQLHYIYWLYVAIQDRLIYLNVPYALCSPTALKKAITNDGRADKGAICAAMPRLWPDVDLGGRGAEDRADGLALAHLGAVRLGWEVPTLQRHRDALAKITWPALPALAVTA